MLAERELDERTSETVRRIAGVTIASLALALTSATTAWSVPVGSLDDTSPTMVLFAGQSESHLYDFGASLIGGPPVIGIPDVALGLAGSATPDDIDGVTTGARAIKFFFSVDRASVGVPTGGPDVFSEALVGQAAGDVYTNGFGGTNILFLNQDILGEQPPIPAGVQTTDSSASWPLSCLKSAVLDASPLNGPTTLTQPHG